MQDENTTETECNTSEAELDSAAEAIKTSVDGAVEYAHKQRWNGLSDQEILAKLRKLSALEYGRQAKDAAKALKISKADLDKAMREDKAKDASADTGGIELFPGVEPWPNAITGDQLLQELAATFQRYAILPAHADTALALWVIFTWCIDAMQVAPILAICSPEKQCGKTTVLTLLAKLVARALPTSNISPAALFRSIESWQPTLLIDEADTFVRNNDELRGVINSGHTRSAAFVLRTVGDNHHPARFSTWSAKAIALIGKLPDTLHDRSIVIELRRKLPGEQTEKLRYSDGSLFIDLPRKLQRFADDNVETLKGVRPELPENISDRAVDNWEPLLAIASLAGGDWLKNALNAAYTLSSHGNDAISLGTELLADMKALFDKALFDKGIEYITTSALIESLCKEEERPWATYNHGEPITPRQIGKLLGGYGIHSKNRKMNCGSVLKSFNRDQCQDAFARYLPNSPENTRYPLPELEMLDNLVAADKTSLSIETHSATEKSSNTAVGSGIADNRRGMGERVEIVL